MVFFFPYSGATLAVGANVHLRPRSDVIARKLKVRD